MNGMNARVNFSSDADDYIHISVVAQADETLNISLKDLSSEDHHFEVMLSKKQAITLREFLLLAYPKE